LLTSVVWGATTHTCDPRHRQQDFYIIFLQPARLGGAPSAKYFHVMALSDGGYPLQPHLPVPPDTLPPQMLKLIERSVAQLNRGRVPASGRGRPDSLERIARRG